MVKTEGARILGYSGTWSSIKQNIICGVTYYLMESDFFGDEMYHIIMNDSGRCVMTSEDGFNPLYEEMDNKRHSSLPDMGMDLKGATYD